jgi:hypothetical protein
VLGGRTMMSDDDLNQNEACEPDPEVISTFDLEEIVQLKRMMALRDPRPDPGRYQNLDSNSVRDQVELEKMLSLGDPRPLKAAWRPYYTAEDLFEDPSRAREEGTR